MASHLRRIFSSRLGTRRSASLLAFSVFASMASFVGSPLRAGEIMSYAYRGMWDGKSQIACGVILGGSGSTPVAVRVLGPSLIRYTGRPVFPDPQIAANLVGTGIDRTNNRWGDQDGNGTTDSVASRNAFIERVKNAGMVDFADQSTGASLDCALAFDSGPVTRIFQINGPDLPDAREFLFEWVNGDTTTDVDAKNVSVRRTFINGHKDILAFTIPLGTTQQVLIQARGPSLAGLVGSLPVLTDPIIALYQGETRLAYNDDWWSNTSATRQQIVAALAATGAQPFGTNNSNTKDAALLVTLGPGEYSVSLWGYLVKPQTNGEVVTSVNLVP